MKNFTISLLAFLSFNFCFSQLYVKDLTNVFVKNTVLYVAGNVNLSGNDSNLYLRNEAQLIQGTSGSSTNTGIGKLSVFQEGTSDNFDYNYWCSPVGRNTAAVGNEGFGVNMFYVPITSTISNPATILPMNNYDGVSSTGALSISPFWLYRYLSSGSYSNWIQSGSTTLYPILAGQGFSMKGTSGSDYTLAGESVFNNPFQPGIFPSPPLAPSAQRYDFRGKPHDGTISIPVIAQVIGTQYPNSTLTGNPYPSAVNLNYFLLESSGYPVNFLTGAVGAQVSSNQFINGVAYYWEQNKNTDSHNLSSYVGGYGEYVPNGLNANSPGTYNNATWKTYNPDGSVNNAAAGTGNTYQRMFAPIGQGFMIRGFANGNATMKNSYRAFRKEGAINNSEFERSSTNLAIQNSGNWDEIPNAAGVDYTQFSRAQVPQIKIHTILNNEITKENTLAFNPNTTDGYDVAMDAVSYDTNTNDAHFSILNDSKSYSITTLPFAIEKRIPFTLKAGVLSSFKIKVSSIINFNGSDTVYLYDGLTGIYHDIVNNFFEISLSQGIYDNRFEITFQDAALSTSNTIKDSFIVFQNNNNQLLSISNPNLQDVKSVILYDISGKLLFDKSSLGTKSNYEFSTSAYSDGVYIVKLQTVDNETLSQKIIISNSN